MKMIKFPKLFGRKKAEIAKLKLQVIALEAELEYLKSKRPKSGKRGNGKKIVMKVQPSKTK